jgi:protein TonB
MERPSHIIFDHHHQSLSRRASFFVVAIGLQLAGFWLFTHGLATHVPTIIRDFQFVPTHDKDVPSVKPPEPKIPKKIIVLIVPPPFFETERLPKPAGDLTTSWPPGNDGGTIKPKENTLHAAVGILSTHTVPPYPPIARRIGAEGTVTLRLTVSAEGRVARAEVVTSSGRDELDQTARAWIVAHWAYKPALENGAAVASQVLATVTFSLSAQR